jgi:putative peptidoglycan lipid II flippase
VGVVATLLIIRQPSQITWLAWAVALGALAGTVAQFAWLHRLGFRFRRAIDWHDPAIRMVGRLLLPAMLTIGVVQVHNAVDRFLASYLNPGSIATLNYAQLVNALPYGVAGVAVVTVLYPNLAEYAAKGERTEFYRVLIEGIRTLAFVLLPMAFGLLLFRDPIIRLLFQRGAFDQQATAATASVLQYATIGILFVGLTDLLNRSFFALKDSLTPMWVAFVAVLVHFLLNLLFVGSLGTGGLALSASLAALVAVGLLLWRLQQRLGALPWASLLRSVATSLATALVGGALGFAVSKLVGNLVSPDHSVGMLVQIGTGLGTLILVHISLTLLVGGPDHDRFTNRIRQKLRGR